MYGDGGGPPVPKRGLLPVYVVGGGGGGGNGGNGGEGVAVPVVR